MAKQIIKWSYWLGAVCAVLALLGRTFNALGIHVFLPLSTRGNAISFRSFLDGAIFLFVISIATATYAGFGSQERRP